MSKPASKEGLIQDRLGKTEQIEVPGVGTVTVRSVSRATAVRAVAYLAVNDVNQYDVVLLSGGITDPAMTEQEVGEWRQLVPPQEVRPITEAIQRLSGMSEDSADPKDDLAEETVASPSD